MLDKNISNIFAHIDELLFVTDDLGRIAYANRAVVNRLGYAKKELMNMRIFDIYAGSDQEKAKRVFSSMFSGKMDTCSLRMRTKSGQFVLTETKAWTGTWDGKEALFCMAKGISKEREMLQKFDTIFENNFALMAISTFPDRVLINVNSSFVKKLGYAKKEVVGKTHMELGLFVDCDKRVCATRELKKTGRAYGAELSINMKSGGVMQGIVYEEVIEDRGKKYLLTIAVDVTRRAEMQETLKESEEKFRSIFEQFQDLYYRTDMKGRIIEVSPSVKKLTGYDREEMIGRKASTVYKHPKDRLVFLGTLIKDGTVQNYELVLKKKTGEDAIVSVNSHIIFDKNKKPVGVEGVMREITDVKEKENEITDMNTRMRVAANAAQYGIWELDLVRNMLVWDDWMYTLYGIKESDSDDVYETWMSLVHPEDLNGAQKQLRQAIKGTGEFDTEFRIVRPDGEIRYIRVYANVVRDKNGKPLKVIGINHDITKDKKVSRQIENALKRQEMLSQVSTDLNQYVDFNETMQSVLEKIGTHMDVSRVYIVEGEVEGTVSKTFEWCAEGVVSQMDYIKDIPYKSIPSFAKLFEKEEMFAASDVSEAPVDIREILEPQSIKSILIFPLKINKKIVGFIVFDQTDRKRTWCDSDIHLMKTVTASVSSVLEKRRNVEEIHKEKDKVEAIIQGIGDGVFVLDEDMRITLFNPMAGVISGYDQKEVIGKKYDDVLKFVFENDTKKTNNAFVVKAMETGVVQTMSNHTMLVTKHGELKPVADSSAPLKNDSGRVFGCVVVFRDATKEREISKMKSEFVSVASHQLKTPMTGIKWMSELALRETLDDKVREYVTDMNKSVNRVIVLIDDLLNVAHIETGRKFDIVKQKTDIVPLVEDVLKGNERLVKKKRVRVVRCVNAPKKLFLNIDAEKIRQAFNNIVGNAIKYSHDGGEVDISCAQTKKDITFSVRDNGIGIPKSQHKRVFEKFFRADNAVQSETDGTGLGLYIAKAIVEAHGGAVWFDSKKGKGTVFHIRIPIG